MSFVQHLPGLQRSLIAASAINPYRPVRLGGSSAVHVLPVATNNERPYGYNGVGTAGASGLNAGETVTVYRPGQVVKAQAAASLGAGAAVGVASTNGALGPIALASGTLKWEHGEALTPADAGEFFALELAPRQIGGGA